MLIDANAHLGSWPFTLAPDRSAAELARHLREEGIGRAVVSPIAAILAPDPLPASRALFEAVKRTPALLPVPVVNPALAHWREQLDAAESGPLRALKLFPNYHNYRLESPKLDAFFAEALARRVRLLISARVEDDRHRYFGLRVKMVPAASVIAFLRRHRRAHPLFLGLGLPELRQIAKACDNFSTDTSFLEWRNGLPDLVREFPARRILFGSHAPFFVTRASAAKLKGGSRSPAAAKRSEDGSPSGLHARTIRAIGRDNAARFFSL